MENDGSIKDKAIVPKDRAGHLSLSSEMIDRGYKIASRIDVQQNVQKCPKLIRYFPGVHARSRVHFSRDGKWALIAANVLNNPDLIIWNRTSGMVSKLSSQEKGLVNLGYMGNGRLWSLAISPHGDLVMAGYDSYDILCWDVEKNIIAARHISGWNTEPVEYMEFIPNTERCVVGYDAGILIIDARSGNRIQSVCHSNSPGQIELLKDGIKLRLEDNGQMKILNLEDKKNERRVYKSAINIKAASSFPNPEKIATIDSGGLITIWNATTCERISQWIHSEILSSSEEGMMSEQWSFFLQDLEFQKDIVNKEEITKRFAGYKGTSIDVSPDGTKILTGGDNYMRFWSLDSNKIYDYPHYTIVVKVAFLPDGRFALSGCLDGSVYLWELPS